MDTGHTQHGCATPLPSNHVMDAGVRAYSTAYFRWPGISTLCVLRSSVRNALQGVIAKSSVHCRCHALVCLQ